MDAHMTMKMYGKGQKNGSSTSMRKVAENAVPNNRTILRRVVHTVLIANNSFCVSRRVLLPSFPEWDSVPFEKLQNRDSDGSVRDIRN